ncbi:ParA family protein [Synechococcus sp. CBW1108]|nr:ParA family protein [Synechococcus sp. CBW1108]
MFITVSGQKGGVAKTCTSIHLASVWAGKSLSVCVVDADRNRSALAYAIRGELPCSVVPVEAAAKATRSADVVITDGQASSDEEELRHLALGSDLVLLPTSPKARAVELTVELARVLQIVKVPHAVLLVKTRDSPDGSHGMTVIDGGSTGISGLRRWLNWCPDRYGRSPVCPG